MADLRPFGVLNDTSDPAMEAFGSLMGVLTYLGIKERVDIEPVLDHINRAIETWVALTKEK